MSKARPVRARKMFGGGGIYFNDIFFAIFDDDRVFFKVDAQTSGDYEARGMGPWILEGEPNENYRELPADIWSNLDKLGEWIEAAAAAAERLSKRKRK